MAKKPVLTDINNISSAGPTINENSRAIKEAFENTISRDGSSPNQMGADLDLNGNDLLNVGTLQALDLTIDGTDSVGFLQKVGESADSAETSAVLAGQYRDEAEALRDEASLYDGPKVDEPADLAGITDLMLPVGAYIRVVSEGSVLKRVASGGEIDHTGVGGVEFDYVIEGVTADTMQIDNVAGTKREAKTFAQVRDALGIYNGARHIKDFCPANGIDDDGPGLAAALNGGAPVIGDNVTLNIQTQAVVDVSSFGASLVGLRANGGETTRTGITIESSLDNPLHVQCSQFNCSGVTFNHTGTAKDTSKYAVVVDREASGINTDDIDARFTEVRFLNYGTAVKVNGRGLTVEGGAVNNCGRGFLWSFPTTGLEGDPIQSDPTLGSRAFEIRGVRGHNIGTLVEQTGAALLRDFMITDCNVDLGDTLFAGGGEDGLIANNICKYSEGLEGGVYITAGGSRMIISGNQLAGGTLAGAMAGTVGIQFALTGNVEDAVISGNLIQGFAWNGIKFNANAVPYRTSVTDNILTNLGRDAIELAGGSFMTSICDGTLANFGVDGVTNRAGIRLSGTHDRLTIDNLGIDPIQATARNVFMNSTPTISNTHITRLNSTYATAISGGYTDGGGNDVTTGHRL